MHGLRISIEDDLRSMDGFTNAIYDERPPIGEYITGLDLELQAHNLKASGFRLPWLRLI
jgi:hypothetical protein